VRQVGGASGSVLNGPAGGGSGGAASEAELLQRGQQAMAQMDPARLRQQAAALRSMDPAQVRRSAPQMAHMTDAQIAQAADQMEQMANDPSMMNAAREQLKSMTPQQMEQMRRQVAGQPPQQQQAPSGGSAAGTANGVAAVASGGGVSPVGDASSMLNMDPAQLKHMVASLKTNPALVQQMMESVPGGLALSEAAFLKQMETLESMDEKQLAAFLSYANKAKWAMDAAKRAWGAVDTLCLGQAKYVAASVGLLSAYLAVSWLRAYLGGGAGGLAAAYADAFGAADQGLAAAGAGFGAAAGVSAGGAAPEAQVEVDEFGNPN
jgi:hypothetical protein